MTLIDTDTDTGLPPLDFSVSRNLNAASAAAREEVLANPGFGTRFTDHMIDICWSVTGGWHRPRVQPYGPLALPELPVPYFIQSLRELIAVDGDWVPSGTDQSLYLRPFMFAKEAFLGVRPAHKVGYYVIASPAGAYFKGGVQPVSIWLSEDYARAGKGGTGAAKTGGNYAASLLPQSEAYENECDQVVFLDADGNVEELGGMNVVFVRKDGTLVTPQSPSILEGITRDSILQLARDRGHRVEGRAVSLAEWRDGVASGDIVEVFACGTAAVVTPIGTLKGRDFLDEQPSGSLALSLREELTDIQYGRREDVHGWLTRLDA
ncbi:MAG: branched-chain amino acid aminotransferase [Microbacterium chocolatum]|nr:branched-chain amino acid aminotransferase [Microbacterium chocolatum]